jgi:ubiquinone/menaquinone biosynthesis C-methylase UbiE
LKHLPEISREHKYYKEWQIRKNSAKKFLKYLNSTNQGKDVLELGSGNGWIAHMISSQHSTQVIGIDINIHEIEQSARVFGKKSNLLFLKADIFDKRLNGLIFDFIILAGTVQYFRDLSRITHKTF